MAQPTTCPVCLGARSALRATLGGAPLFPSPWDGTAPGFSAKQYFPPGTIWPGYSAIPTTGVLPEPGTVIETCPTCKGGGVLWN